MALSTGSHGGGGRRGRRRKKAALTEINVTPLVDVMLVLLIIFMISAPLLNAGIKVHPPKTEAAAVKSQDKPLTVTIQKDGAIYVMDDSAQYEEIVPRLRALSEAKGDQDPSVYVRADGAAPYESVAKVMAKLSVSGFSKINLLTETSGAKPALKAPPGAPADSLN